MENNGQWTNSIKMGADTPNTPKFVCPSPKVWDFNKKGFIGRPMSVDWPVNQRMEFQEGNSTKISIM